MPSVDSPQRTIMGTDTTKFLGTEAQSTSYSTGESGSDSAQRSEGRFVYQPDEYAGEGYGTYQDAGGLNALQQSAIDRQTALRDSLGDLYADKGAGQRAAIESQYDTHSKNVTGSLIGRGFGGSSLNLVGQAGVEAGRQAEFDRLEEALMGQRMSDESQISSNISDLLFGSEDQRSKLFDALLGSGGIGRDDTGTSSSYSLTSGASQSTGIGAAPTNVKMYPLGSHVPGGLGIGS